MAENLTKKCAECHISKPVKKFIVNPYQKDSLDIFCNDCRKKLVFDEESLKRYCDDSGRGWNNDLFKKALEETEKKLKKMNVAQDKFDSELILKSINYYFSKMNLTGNESYQKTTNSKNKSTLKKKDIPEYLLDKWGDEWEPKDIYYLENLYQEMKLSFRVESASSEDYLKKICVASVMSDKELRIGNVDKAKKWIEMYDNLMKSSKMAPVQASAADALGVSTFSQFVEIIEKDGFIPKYPNVPQDDIDVAILSFINYNRKLIRLNDINLEELKSDIGDDNE